MTADVYPKYPTITDELKNQGKISVGADGTPLGQERVKLRASTLECPTGINGTLTGTHALVNNALASKLPFAQAARHLALSIDDPTNFEARTNEIDHFGLPPTGGASGRNQRVLLRHVLLEYVTTCTSAVTKAVLVRAVFRMIIRHKTIRCPRPCTFRTSTWRSTSRLAKTPSPTDPTSRRKFGLDNGFRALT